MIDIEYQATQLVEEVLEFLEDSPVKLTELLYHDTLYERCYQEIIDRLADECEARADEEKLKDYNECN